jgi:hypothetical protein
MISRYRHTIYIGLLVLIAEVNVSLDSCKKSLVRPSPPKRPSAHSFCHCTTIMSSQVKLLITNNSFCIFQRATAHLKKRIFRDCGIAEAPPGFQADWSDCVCISLSFCSKFSLIWRFPCKFLYSWGYIAVSKLSPDFLSGGGRCLFWSTRHFRTANSTPMISISRHLAPFKKLGRKVITQKGLFQSSAPDHLCFETWWEFSFPPLQVTSSY